MDYDSGVGARKVTRVGNGLVPKFHVSNHHKVHLILDTSSQYTL